MICSICHKPIPVEHGTWTKGHNAQPVNAGRCCWECNERIVVPARVRVIERQKQEQKRNGG